MRKTKPSYFKCKQCKEDFPTDMFFRVYCSDKCRKKYKQLYDRKKHYEKTKKNLDKRLCIVCEKNFIPNYENDKICSSDCQSKRKIILANEIWLARDQKKSNRPTNHQAELFKKNYPYFPRPQWEKR